MKIVTQIKKSFVLISLSVIAATSVADVQQGYIITRIQFDGVQWQVAEPPQLIPCQKEFGALPLTADHSIVEGYDNLDVKVAEYRFPNPRLLYTSEGDVLANTLVTDLIIPADAGVNSIEFRELQGSVSESLAINVSGLVDATVECEAPVFELLPEPTEVASEEV